MKKILLLGLIFFSGVCHAQFTFRTAGSESGIIATPGGANVGYSFSDSEAIFSYGFTSQKTMTPVAAAGSIVGRKGNRAYAKTGALTPALLPALDYKSSNFKVTVPVTDGTDVVYSSGKFNPGVGVSYEYVRNKDEFNPKKPYKFIRVAYKVKENKFGSVNLADSIQIDKKTSHDFGLTVGANWIWSIRPNQDDLVVASSIAFQYFIDPVVDLETKEFVTVSETGVNGSVQETQNAFEGSQQDFFAVIPKLDFCWTPIIIEDLSGELARIGLFGSLSARYNARVEKAVYNFSVGPSIHPKNSSSQVIAALQAQFIDFGDVTGTKNFSDIFSIGFYIGIPLTK